MAIEIPSDWPPRGWAEVPPSARLRTSSATETRYWQVAGWSSVREITSSALPGQVRHKTGLSIGTGKATLVRTESLDLPWKQRAVFGLTGADAAIEIAPPGGTRIPTGQFRVADVEGDLTSPAVDVDLDEKQIEGATKSANVPGSTWQSWSQIDDTDADPAWFIEQLAQQMGYGVGRRPGESLESGFTDYRPILDIPFQGSLVPVYPPDLDFTEIAPQLATFGDFEGQGLLGVTGVERDGVGDSAYIEYRTGAPIVRYSLITMDLVGDLQMQWDHNDTQGVLSLGIVSQADLEIPLEELELRIFSWGDTGAYNGVQTLTVNMPIPEDRPYGIQVHWEVIGNGTAYTSSRVRIRRGPDTPWSAWLNHTMTNTLRDNGDPYEFELNIGDGPFEDVQGRLARVTVMDTEGFQLDAVDDLAGAMWRNTSGVNGRIFLEPLYGTVTSPWLDPDLTVWGAMQAIVNAWMGALITDVYGNLHLINRYSLVGVGTGQEKTVDVGRSFEDLPWVMSYTDQADRLVVRYRPVVKVRTTWPSVIPVVWEATEVITLPPGVTEIFVDLNYVFPVDLKLIPFAQKGTANESFYHTWDAWTRADGTGTRATPNDMIQMRVDRLSSSTWKVYVVNLTAAPLYMVDNTGSPYLKLRSSFYWDQSVEQTVERGVGPGDATNALEVDLSTYVQNETDANLLTDFLWGRVNARTWRAKTVNQVPDYSLDLGDVREAIHSRTGLRTNVLVTKVDFAGEPGSVVQKIEFITLPPTWEDFDEVWGVEYHTSPPGSWNEFDALWDNYTWDDFDRAPTATTVAQIEESM